MQNCTRTRIRTGTSTLTRSHAATDRTHAQARLTDALHARLDTHAHIHTYMYINKLFFTEYIDLLSIIFKIFQNNTSKCIKTYIVLTNIIHADLKL